MAEMAPSWETRIAALAAEPGFARLREPATPVILWSAQGRPVWRSQGGAALLHEGAEALPARTEERLRLLAGGLAPRTGFRLERLRLGALVPPVTFACRLLAEEEGDVLLTAILDSPPASRSLAAFRSAHEPVAFPQEAGGESPQAADEAPAPRRGIRFVWRADAEGRFTHLPPPLADCVGSGAASALGRRWDDLLGRIVTDESGAIGRAFSQRESWSRRPAGWRNPEADRLIPLELSGAPDGRSSGAPGGWRGFGIAYPDEARPVSAGAFRDLEPLAETVAPEATEPAVAGGEAVFGMLRSWFSARLGSPLPAGLPQGGAGGHAAPAAETGEPAPADESPAEPTDGAEGRALSLSERGALHEIARALGGEGEGAAPEGQDLAEIVALPVQHVRSGEPTRLLDDMPVGIAVLRDGVPLFVNRFLLERLSARDLPDLVATDALQPILGLDPDGTRATTVALGSRPDGQRGFEARASRVGWGDLGAVLVVLTPPPPASAAELDAAKLELARREASQRDLAAALDIAADGVVTLDAAARLLSLNGAAERLFGLRANEVVGDSITALIEPRDHRALLVCLDSLRKGPPDGRAECELRGRARDGTTVPFSVRAGRSLAGDGTGFVVAFRDVTPFRLLEEDLREARASAERASANRADFLARISHEVRTPLTAITGFAELMLEERFGPLGNERYKEYLKDVRDSGVHVISLVNDLLDLAKATSGRSDLEPAAVDLNLLAQQCVGLTGPLAGRERTILRTSFSAGLPSIFADERSVRQIVINVLSNAIRFAGAGGQVIVSTAMGGHGEVVLSVRDTGPGMSEEEIAEALTPFRQVPSTRRSDGTGLGLPLSKALAEANGGTLTVTSGRDLGTLVEVRLPALRPAAADAVAAE